MYSAPDGIKYFVGHESVTWSEAELYRNSRGTNLASIHSEEDNQAAFDACPGDACWIGLYGYYAMSWTDGTDLDYESWIENTPRLGEYPCVTLWYWAWSDGDCS